MNPKPQKVRDTAARGSLRGSSTRDATTRSPLPSSRDDKNRSPPSSVSDAAIRVARKTSSDSGEDASRGTQDGLQKQPIDRGEGWVVQQVDAREEVPVNPESQP